MFKIKENKILTDYNFNLTDVNALLTYTFIPIYSTLNDSNRFSFQLLLYENKLTLVFKFILSFVIVNHLMFLKISYLVMSTR